MTGVRDISCGYARQAQLQPPSVNEYSQSGFLRQTKPPDNWIFAEIII
jgi:hypothetical protein